MSHEIVALMILMILFQLVSININLKTARKADQIKFYEDKLGKAKQLSITDGSALFALLVALSIRVAIIYYAVIIIMSFIK